MAPRRRQPSRKVNEDALRKRILQWPDAYVGPVEKRTRTLWVYEGFAMARRAVTYVPGLYKIFDEILVHAATNKRRDPAMDALYVEIDAAECRISVFYNGDGVPVVEVQEQEPRRSQRLRGQRPGVYLPELFFGCLLDHSNHADAGADAENTTGGRKDYGVKLTNIFSTEFVIETADGHRQRKYKQDFSENMGKKSEPEITGCQQGENWTLITFKPDLARFNMTHLDDDIIALMRKRVVEMASILGITVLVEFNGIR
ncbi:hypothetical protein ACP70R_009811 [Stipagrostis hirtigluma subsp. patula]